MPASRCLRCASGQTVYDYVYSGQYIDGSGSEYGQFTDSSLISGVAVDEARNRVLVAIGGGFWASRRWLFSRKTVFLDELAATQREPTHRHRHRGRTDPVLSLDNTGGPADRNCY